MGGFSLVMSEYRKLTRKGKLLEPDNNTHSNQNIRKRWKFQSVILRFLVDEDKWVSTKGIQEHLVSVYPKTAPTVNQCASYLGTMHRRNEIDFKRGKPNRWRINL